MIYILLGLAVITAGLTIGLFALVITEWPMPR